MHRCFGPARIILLAPALAANVAVATGTTITVTTAADAALGTDDGGHCTLREALHAASKNVAAGSCPAGQPAPAVDTIAFAIPDQDAGCNGSTKVCTITPAAVLEAIQEPVFIDGYTQPGSSPNTLALGDDAVILIELDARNGSPALYLDGSAANGGASNTTIRGIALTHAPSGDGIYGTQLHGFTGVGPHFNGLTVIGNFIGTDASGMTSTASATAIHVSSSSEIAIGSAAAADRNVIVAPGVGEGLTIEVSNGCTVQGNYIATDRTGLAGLPVYIGIHLAQSSSCQIGGGGAGNVIGEIHDIGIESNIQQVGGSSSNNVIQGNRIGTDATGTSRLSVGFGIILGVGTGNVIGGTGDGEGNVISGNGGDGIEIGGSGSVALIEGNRIGTDITGTLPLGNGWCGIDVIAGASTATVGGTLGSTRNIIAFNHANGISIGDSSANWAIEGNSIHDNASLGISWGGRCDDQSTTPTAYADGDPHNYPTLSTVTIGSGGTGVGISGKLSSTMGSSFRLEFFANAACDDSNPVMIEGKPAHTGEGKVFIGTTDVSTPADSNDAPFGELDFAVPRGRHVITATATNKATGSTSEFSVCSDQDTIFTDDLEGE